MKKGVSKYSAIKKSIASKKARFDAMRGKVQGVQNAKKNADDGGADVNGAKTDQAALESKTAKTCKGIAKSALLEVGCIKTATSWFKKAKKLYVKGKDLYKTVYKKKSSSPAAAAAAAGTYF